MNSDVLQTVYTELYTQADIVGSIVL